MTTKVESFDTTLIGRILKYIEDLPQGSIGAFHNLYLPGPTGGLKGLANAA